MQPADWSPDGKNLLVVHDAAGRAQLEYPAGTVLYVTAGWMSNPRASPDGGSSPILTIPLAPGTQAR